MSWLLLVLLALAAYRLTRLLTRDELPLVKLPRDAIANWLDPRDPKTGAQAEPAPLGGFGRAIAYGLECDWCTSVWVAGGLVWATASTVGVPWPWLTWAAVAGVVGLIATAEQRAEQWSQLTELRTVEVQAELRRRGVSNERA